MHKYILALLISLYFLPALDGQCPVNTSCQSITDAETIAPETMFPGDPINKDEYRVCLDEAAILEDYKFTNYAGDAIRAVLAVEVENVADQIFISAYTASGQYQIILNVMEGTSCFNAEFISTTLDDITPEVHGVAVNTGQTYFLDIIIPVNPAQFQEDELIVEVFATSFLQECEPIDLQGKGDKYDFDLSYRSLGNEGDPLYPGELVTLNITYEYRKDLVNSPEWLHSITPIIGKGWIVDTTQLIEYPPVESGGKVSEFVPEDEDCGVTIKEDLNYFCSYQDESGYTRLCNMLTHRCPCEDEYLVADETVGTCWVFQITGGPCGVTCSPSSSYGIGFVQAFVNLKLDLIVDPSIEASNDFQIGILNLSDVISGCYTSTNSCTPAFASWSPDWQEVDRTKSYGIIGAAKDTVCYQEQVGVNVALNVVSDGDAFVRVNTEEGISYNGGDHPIVSDSLFEVLITNETDSIRTVEIDLVIDEGGVETVVSTKRVTLLPDLEIYFLNRKACPGSCIDVQVLNNHEKNYTYYLGGIQIEEDPFSLFICPNDTLSVRLDEGTCGQDTALVFSEEVDPIEVFYSTPNRMCKNGIVEAEPINIITIDSISGGVPPYEINFNSSSTTFIEEIEGDGIKSFSINEELIFTFDFSALLNVSSQGGCLEFVSFDIPMLRDSLIGKGAFCKDGIFDPEDPTIFLELEDYGKTITEYTWLKFGIIEGQETEDGDYIVNEEESEFVDATVQGAAVAVLTEFDDGCSVSTFFEFTIFDDNRSFDFAISDFEVDFVPLNPLGIVSIVWDFGDGNTSDDFFPTHIYEEVGSYSVSMEIIDLCDTSIIERTVIISGTPTEEVLVRDSKLFPNPSTGILYLEKNDTPQAYQVFAYDMNGRVVEELSIHETSKLLEIDMSTVPSGMYFIKITQGQHSKYSKVLIQNQ